MTNQPTSSRVVMRELAPKLAQVTDDVLFGDIWERPELSKRDRSLITVAALIATYRTDQIRLHIRRALQNGVTKEEIGEVITPPRLLLRLAHRRQRHHGHQGSIRRGLAALPTNAPTSAKREHPVSASEYGGRLGRGLVPIPRARGKARIESRATTFSFRFAHATPPSPNSQQEPS